MRLAAIALLGAGLLPAIALAQAWPSQQVTVIVPQPPGNPSDLLARLVSNKLQEKWGKPVVVENKGGASGTIGTNQVALARPDGYTLLFSFDVPITIAPNLMKVAYDPLKDLELVAAFASTELALFVTPAMGVKTFPDLIAKLKGSPGKFTYGSGGIGTPAHLCMELVRQATGTELVHSPYRASAAGLQALMSGEVDIFCGPPSGGMPLVESGRAVVVGSTGAKRSPRTPQLPTLMESGIPGLEVTTKMLLLAPKGVPADVMTRIRSDLREVVAQPDIQQRITSGAYDLVWLEGEDGAREIARDFEKWGRVIQKGNIKPE